MFACLLVRLEEQELLFVYLGDKFGKFGPIISVHKNPAHMVGCVEEDHLEYTLLGKPLVVAYTLSHFEFGGFFNDVTH